MATEISGQSASESPHTSVKPWNQKKKKKKREREQLSQSVDGLCVLGHAFNTLPENLQPGLGPHFLLTQNLKGSQRCELKGFLRSFLSMHSESKGLRFFGRKSNLFLYKKVLILSCMNWRGLPLHNLSGITHGTPVSPSLINSKVEFWVLNSDRQY